MSESHCRNTVAMQPRNSFTELRLRCSAIGIGSGMAGTQKFHQLQAMLEWQVALGVDEAILDAPVDRYALAKAPKPEQPTAPEPSAVPPAGLDPVAEAQSMARSANNLDALADALTHYDHCELKLGARNLVFADGRPEARVMIIGEAPGRDEDLQGRPFVGRAGQLLDRMFAAINMARDAADAKSALYITNILPWRPPQNRDPSPEEVAMLRPFVERHVELADPEVIVLMGNISCGAILGQRGITRLRGKWVKAFSRPVLPMFHPAYLLRNPQAKREAWHDLLMLQAKLREMP